MEESRDSSKRHQVPRPWKKMGAKNRVIIAVRIGEIMACFKAEGKEPVEVDYVAEKRNNCRRDGSQEGMGSKGQVEGLFVLFSWLIYILIS